MSPAAGQAFQPGGLAAGDSDRVSGRVWRGEVRVDRISGKVLLVSGDAEAGRFWADALRRCGADVAVACSAREALEPWEQGGFDLILVDVSAQADGLDLCRRLRARAVNPILLLCPCEDETCVLEAYRAGADECILKPVSPATFLAKVGAWLRHQWTLRVEALDPLARGGIRLEPGRRVVVTPQGAVVPLTALELRLLYLLMAHPGQVLPPDLMAHRVWGRAGGDGDPIVTKAVSRLQLKIEPDPQRPRYIRTVPGQGYTFCG